MNIVFLINRDKLNLVLQTLEDGYKVGAIILPYSSNMDGELCAAIRFAKENNIPVLKPKLSELKAKLEELRPDVLLSASYPYLLKSEHLSVAKYNINIHPTLLPKYRGPATAWHIIANGEKETGVTIHQIDEGMDTGPILVQLKAELTILDTLKTAMQKSLDLEPMALQKALHLLKTCQAKFVPQDESLATTYTNIRTPEDSRIDPDLSMRELYNFIRACDPHKFPAFFELEGKRIGIQLFALDEFK